MSNIDEKVRIIANKAIPVSKRAQVRHFLQLCIAELMITGKRDQTSIMSVYSNRFRTAELPDGEWPAALIWTLAETHSRISNNTVIPECDVSISVVQKTTKNASDDVDLLADQIKDHLESKLKNYNAILPYGNFDANTLILNVQLDTSIFKYEEAKDAGFLSATLNYRIKYNPKGLVIKS